MKTPSFICLNNDGYDGLRRPRHILMQRLSRMGFDVLFVSSAVRYWSQRLSRAELKLGGVKRIGPGFHWYQPPFFLLDSSRPLLGKISLAFRVVLLHAMLAFFARGRRIFFVTVPDKDYIKVINKYKNSIVIYNVHDMYLDQYGHWVDGHEDVLKRADIILCTSKALVKEVGSQIDKEILFFPPGIDFDLFPQDVSYTPHSDQGRAIVGCIGNLGDQIDWPLLRDVAARAKGFEFRLVGPVVKAMRSNPAFLAFEGMPNVRFMGEVSHDQIPGLVRSFDLCIMPYALNDFTKGVNPLKLIEYFALGKPVVSSAIASVEDFRETVYVASGADEWLDALRRAMAEDTQEKFEERRRLALAQDYDSRIRFLLGLLDIPCRDRTS